MKKLSIAVAAVAALALVGTPAYADNNGHGHGKGHGAERSAAAREHANVLKHRVQVTGSITALDTSTAKVTVLVKTLPQNQKIFRQLKNTAVTFLTDTATQIRRSDTQTGFASLMVGDHVSIKAAISWTSVNSVRTLSWYALRINARAADTTPTPTPAEANLNFRLGGVIVGNNGTNTLTVSVLNASIGNGLTLNARSVAGSKFTVFTDTSTVISGISSPSSPSYQQLTLLSFPAVNMTGTCTAGVTPVCTASRIDVIVSTP